MTHIRRRLKLWMVYFQHRVYEFAGTNYFKALIDFSLDDTYSYWFNAEDIGDTTNTTDTKIKTDEYIYPMPLKAISILDGTVKGQLKYGIKCEAAGTAKISYFAIKLIKRTAAGGSVDLTSEHTATVNVTTTDTSFVPFSFPFFFHVDNVELKSEDRLMVHVEIWGKSTVAGKSAYFRRYYAMNSDDQMIDIPIV